MVEFAKGAHLRGIEVIIAGAGGAAHLPGITWIAYNTNFKIK
jgi:5-(carboxyamino)imidazole ribonucleotide mutase